MGLCSLFQRPDQPAPRVERGQPTLEIATLLPSPFLCKQNPQCGNLSAASDTPVNSCKEARAGGQRSRDTARWEKSQLLPGQSGSPLCSSGLDALSSQGVRSSRHPLKVRSVALGFPSLLRPPAGPLNRGLLIKRPRKLQPQRRQLPGSGPHQ